MSGTLMIAQIQLTEVRDPQHARLCILERKAEVQAICDDCDPVLLKLGGGFRELEVRVLDTRGGPMVITHIVVDTRDAMGANAVNTMAEKLAPHIALWTAGRTNLRILSNLADQRLARARCVWPLDAIGGAEVRDAMLSAYHFADADPYRAATHNKGIMNGVSAVVLATGNDTRAVEAGAHAYAARSGRYQPLAVWRKDGDDLVGELEMPLALGIVGGTLRVHPLARLSLAIMKVRSSGDLSMVAASVGLASNLAALRALATEGIQRGHMSLHARSIAIAAGAVADEVEAVAGSIVDLGRITLEAAQASLHKLRGKP
jgi:hydroxymethylglutaryl-CoA reductase